MSYPSMYRFLSTSIAAVAALTTLAASAFESSINPALVYNTGYSNFNIPGITLTTEQKIDELAHYPLILGVQRFHYDDLGSTTWDEIRARNPGAKIMLYQMASGSREDSPEYPTSQLNTINRWTVGRGHPEGTLNDHPEFILYQTIDNVPHRIKSDGTNGNTYWLAFGLPAYQDYWTVATIDDLLHKVHEWDDPLDPVDEDTDRPWTAQGLFVDNASAYWVGDLEHNETYTTLAAWQEAMLDFTAAATSGIRAYNSSQLMYFNVSFTKLALGAAHWANLDALPIGSRPDGVLEEDAFATSNGPWSVQFYLPTEWKRQVDTLAAMQHLNAVMESRSNIAPGGTGTDNYEKSVSYWDVVWYSLSSYLLGKNDVANNSYFTYWHARDYSYLDEYDLDIGKALGAYTTQSVSSTGGTISIYMREFEKGWVFVNPNNPTSTSVSLPGVGKPLGHATFQDPIDIANVDSLVIPGNRGIVVLKDPVIGDWRFDATSGSSVVDSHEFLPGDSLDGTTSGSPTWLPGAGIVDGALQFDGTDDYVLMNQDTDRLVTPDALSISLWVKLDSGTTGNQKATIMQFGTWHQSGWQLLAGAGWNEFRFHLYGGSAVEQAFSKPLQSPLPNNQWVHLAVTVENKTGGNVKMYVNGAPFHASTLTAPFNSSASDVLYIGTNALNITNSKYWGGKMDNVRIERKVLSPDDVAAEFRSQVADWRLDEPAYRRKAFDNHGSAHGTVHGNPQWLGTGGSGAPRGAVEFDGVDDEIVIERNVAQLAAANRQFTLNAWVQPSATGIISQAMEHGEWFESGWVLYASKEQNDLALLVFDGSGSYQAIQATPSTPLELPTSSWSKVTVSVDNKLGGEVKIYVNGSPVAMSTESSTNPTSTPCSPCTLEAPIASAPGDTLTMGRSNVGFWEGRLGHVQLFGRILSAAEIGQLTD